jgi:TatD DNase family protein
MTPTAGTPQVRVGPELIDTHCHLVLLQERGLLGAALESAAEAGVTQIVTVGLDVDDSDQNREIAERTPGVWFTVGWHPHTPTVPGTVELAALRELLDHPRAVAVGEIGLDWFWRPGYHEVPPEVQTASMRAMLELAADARKPVVVHDRDAHADTLDALRAGLRPADGADPLAEPVGVLHCFSADAEMARDAARLGMVASFAGTVTFPRSEGIQAAARDVADTGFVVETDAPFLAPVPHRGRPNVPGYVAATLAAVARLRGIEHGEAARLSTATARRLFGLPAARGADRVRGA